MNKDDFLMNKDDFFSTATTEEIKNHLMQSADTNRTDTNRAERRRTQKGKKKNLTNSIEFTGDYVKLHNQKSAILLQVNYMKVDEDLPQALIDYDTERLDGSHQFLPYGYYGQLIFLGEFGIPFSAIRKQTVEELEYCTKNIDKKFKIIIRKEQENG